MDLFCGGKLISNQNDWKAICRLKKKTEMYSTRKKTNKIYSRSKRKNILPENRTRK